jgi:glycosyltransferase 2 family protein
MISFNKKTYFSLGIGLLFSALALYFTFKNIPLQDLAAYLKRINYFWIIPSLLIALASYLIRIWRWQVILIPVKRSGFKSALHPLAIGFMLNCILPGRIGEIARPAIYYKRENVEFSKVLGTAAIERIFDALCLLIFFIYILATINIDESVNVTFAGYHLSQALLGKLFKFTLEVSIALIAIITLISISKTRKLINRVIMKLPDLLFFLGSHVRETVRERIFLKITHFVDNLSVGFDILKSPGLLLLTLVQSFVLWWMLGASVWVLAFGCPGINITFLQAFAVEIIICFAIMLPSVPGYWGLWEAGGVFGLSLFGIPAKEAAGMILTYHFFHLIPVILIGLVSAMIIGVNITQATQNGKKALDMEEEQEQESSRSGSYTGTNP